MICISFWLFLWWLYYDAMAIIHSASYRALWISLKQDYAYIWCYFYGNPYSAYMILQHLIWYYANGLSAHLTIEICCWEIIISVNKSLLISSGVCHGISWGTILFFFFFLAVPAEIQTHWTVPYSIFTVCIHA